MYEIAKAYYDHLADKGYTPSWINTKINCPTGETGGTFAVKDFIVSIMSQLIRVTSAYSTLSYEEIEVSDPESFKKLEEAVRKEFTQEEKWKMLSKDGYQ